MNTFLILPLNDKRDLLVARQRARQVAAMLHFEATDQLAIAAGTLAVATQTSAFSSKAQLCFALDGKSLCIFTQAADVENEPPSRIKHLMQGAGVTHLRLVRALPDRARTLSLDDLAFILGKLPSLPVPKLFDEMLALNQEVLALLHTLHISQKEVKEKQPKPVKPSAA